MKPKLLFIKAATFVLLAFFLLNAAAQQKKNFNKNWEFFKDKDTVFSFYLTLRNSPIKWDKISLPHTANFEPI